MDLKYRIENSGHKDSFEVGSTFQDFVCIELAKQEIGNIRLSKKEVANVTGYSPAYLSGLDVPFHNGMIRYNELEEWIWEHKPNRLKRVKKNIKNYLS